MEWLKEVTDRLLLWFLRATSRFGKELTLEGKVEQAMWREQRLRNLEGLATRSRQRFGDKNKSV
jgi:hypothetical protein